MTDQTQFERELTDRMRARADRTRVDLDHDRIVGAPRPVRRAPGRPTWAVAGAFAAVIALVVAGLALLIRTGDDEPAPADTFAPVLPVPVTTVPPPPDHGVLDDTEGPTINDHWHVAYGFFLCGQWFQLQGNLEDQDAQGNFTNETFLSTGIHSHDDGVIHVHPHTEAGAGENATLGTFLAGYGVELGDGGLVIPADQPMATALPCDISTRDIVVAAWPSFTSTSSPIIVRSGLAGVPLGEGAVITITDAPDEAVQPPWAADLPALAALDTPQSAPEDPLQSLPTTAITGTIAPMGPITDFAACGRAVGAAADLGIATERLDVAADGSSFELALRNTTPDPVTVGVAPFLTTLGPDRSVASRPSVVGVWQYQVVSPGESLTVPVEEAVGGAGVLGLVTCDAAATPEPAGEREFVAVLDIDGTIVASDPVIAAIPALPAG